MGFGKNLESSLKAHKISVAELSRRTGISVQTLYSIIHRDSNRVDLDTAQKIENAIGDSAYSLSTAQMDFDSFRQEKIKDMPLDDGPVYQSSAWEDFFDAFINFGNSLPDGYSVHAGSDVGRVFLTYPDGNSSKEVSIGDLHSVVKKAQDYMRYELDQFRKGKT